MIRLLLALRITVVCAIIFESPTAAQFGDTTVSFSVNENAPSGTQIGNIFDASNNIIKPPLVVLEQIPSGLHLDLSDGVLSILYPLDREFLASYSFLILYGDEANLAKVVVNVADENDNAPSFDVVHLEFNISESTPVPKCWPLPSPKDPDVGNNSIVSSNLLNESLYSYFKIEYDERNLRLSLCLIRELDYEVAPRYNLTVRATDGGGRFADLFVTVDVFDENEYVPAFEVVKYETTVHLADITNGKPLLFAKATDQDSGENGLVKYSMSPRFINAGLPFAVDESTGAISVNIRQSRISETTYSFFIRAFDGGKPSLESEVPVFIRVTNLKRSPASEVTAETLLSRTTGAFNTKPSDNGVNFAIHRDYPPGSFVGDLSSNPNAKHLLRNGSYELSGGAFISFLTLHRVTGVLTLSRWLPCDLESIEGHRQATDGHHVFRLRLAPTSGGFIISTAPIDIIISVSSDVRQFANLGCLAFQRPMYQFTVVQNSATSESRTPGDYCFGKVQAVDSDRCSSIRYSLTASSHKVPVYVNEATGFVCLKSEYWKLPQQINTALSLQIAARNEKTENLAYAIARVEFLGQKSLLTQNVDEQNETWWNVTLSPAFKRNDVLFTVIQGSIGADAPKNLKVSSSRSSLLIDVSPCSAMDQAANCLADSSSAIFTSPAVFQTSSPQGKYTLNILPACSSSKKNNDDAPSQVSSLPLLSTNSLQVYLADFADNFTLVDKKLQLKSAVSSDVLYKSLIQRSQCVFSLDSRCQGFVSVSPESGFLHIQSLPHANFECIVYATSSIFPFLNSSVATIRFIWPKTPVPTSLEASLFYSVSENSPAGTVVGVVPLSLRRSLLPFQSDWFQFDFSSGILKTSQSLDREQSSHHSLPGGAVVSVEDVNDNPPKCLFPDGYTREIFIPDSWTSNEFYVGRVRAVDVDYLSNGTIGEFSISPLDHPYFRINSSTGDIYLSGVHNFAAEFSGLKKLLLRVSISDRGTPRITTDCFIKLVFRKSDNLTLSSVLLPITVRLGEEVELPNLSSSEDISMVANFDGPLCDFIEVRPSGTSVVFSVASDFKLDKSLFDNLSCAIYLNSNRIVVPFFVSLESQQIANNENAVPKSLVFSTNFSSRRSSVIASLNDAFESFGVASSIRPRFEVVFCSQPSFLSIDRANSLIANWDFYFDGLSSIHCLISSSAGSLSSVRHLTNVFIEISAFKPETDAAPKFILPLASYVPKKIYGPVVFAGMPIVSALAYTTLPDAEVSYSLENKYDGLFEINSENGLVSFNRDFSSSGNMFLPGSVVNFRLTLLAQTTSNQDLPSMTSTNFDFDVEWPLNSSNDLSIHEFVVLENAPRGSVIGRLPLEKYFSMDSAISARYAGYDNVNDIPFSLPSPPSWTLITTKQMSMAFSYGLPKPSVTVPLLITGVPHNASNETTFVLLIRVVLKSVNNAVPTFQERVVHLTVQENVEYKNLFQAIAFDQDFSNGAQILEYSFAGNLSSVHSGLFSIDRSTGLVSCRPLDRETNAVYNLTIFSSDGLHESSMDLVLLVLDSNDNAPAVQKSRFDISLSGSERVGDKIFQVIATDRDSSTYSHGRLVFTLNDGYDLFELDSTTGDIKLIQFPAGQATEWNLVVTVSDSVHLSETLVVVHLEPGANAAFAAHRKAGSNLVVRPFAMTQQKAFIKEGMPKGAMVAQISSRNRRDIKFSIKSGNSDQAFAVDDQSAELHVIIRTRTMLDAEIRALYTLEIVAVNVTSGVEMGSCELSIFVLDVNDNEPSFTSFIPISSMASSKQLEWSVGVDQQSEPAEVVSVSTLARPGSRLGTLIGSDPDSTSWLTYSLVNEDAALYLAVNPVSGDVFLRNSLPLGKIITAEFAVSDAKHRSTIRKMSFSSNVTSPSTSPDSSFSRSSILDQLVDHSLVFSGSVLRCSEKQELLTLLPKETVSRETDLKFAIIAPSPIKNWFSISAEGAIVLDRSSLPSSTPDKVNIVVSARKLSSPGRSPLFLLVTFTGLQKCVAQPVISSSSMSLLELPRAATKSLKPGSSLTKIETDYATGVMFRLSGDDGYFGVDAEGNLRLLKPISSVEFDLTIKIFAVNPLSLLKASSYHSVRIRVVSVPGEALLAGRSLARDHKIVELYLRSSVTSTKSTELLDLADFFGSNNNDNQRPSIALSSSPGAFSIVNNMKLHFLTSAFNALAGDYFVVVSAKQSSLIVIIHTDSLETSPAVVLVTDINENSRIPSFVHNVMPATASELVDCETVCCYVAKTVSGNSHVPHVLRVADVDEFPFAYEQPASTNAPVFEFKASRRQQKGELVGCLAPVDFDNGAAGVWRMAVADSVLPPFLTLSPYEGCFYLGSSKLRLGKHEFAVSYATKMARVVVNVVDELTTLTDRTLGILTVTTLFDSSSSSSTNSDTLIIVLSTAIPLAFVIVASLVVFAVYCRRRWRRLMKDYSRQSGLKKVGERDADSGWIYRMMSALSTKQTTMVGRTNSFNTIGFTSVKYEPRPPSNTTTQSAVNRASICVVTQEQQQPPPLGGTIYGVNFEYSEQGMQVIPSSADHAICSSSSSSSYHNRATTVFRQSESGGSVSSGVDVSSSSGSNSSGPPSCSPPPVTTISGHSPVVATPLQAYFTYNSNYEVLHSSDNNNNQQPAQLEPAVVIRSDDLVADNRFTRQPLQPRQVATHGRPRQHQHQNQLPHSASYYSSQTAGHKTRRSQLMVENNNNNNNTELSPAAYFHAVSEGGSSNRPPVLYTRCTRAPIVTLPPAPQSGVDDGAESPCNSQYV